MKFLDWLRPSWRLLAISAAAAAAIAGGSAGRVVYLVEHGRLTALQADVRRQASERQTAIVRAAAVSQAAQDKISVRSAVTHAQAQERIVHDVQTVTQEITRYVTVQQDAVGCIPYGFIRVLDAAATGRDPADLELPAGQSNDDCSPLDPSVVARGIVDGFIAPALQNAQQLNDLEADIAQRVAAANAGGAAPKKVD